MACIESYTSKSYRLAVQERNALSEMAKAGQVMETNGFYKVREPKHD